MTKASETQSQTEQLEPAAPDKPSGRKSILALSVFALGLNATAAVYTLSPSDFALPYLGSLTELLPHQEASAPRSDQVLAAALPPSFDVASPSFGTEQLSQPKPSAPISDPVLTALKDIQSAQQQHVVSLEENYFSLQQGKALLQQNSDALASLRQSITDEHLDLKTISAQISDENLDVKKMSDQISTLIAKVDSLQNALKPELTSSIPRAHARKRLSGVPRKSVAAQAKPVKPVSDGGAPLSSPATIPTPEG